MLYKFARFPGNGTQVSRFRSSLVFTGFHGLPGLRNLWKPKCIFTDAGPCGLGNLNMIVKKVIPTWTNGLHAVQLELVSAILDRKNVLCCTVTGDGKLAAKFLCYWSTTNTRRHMWLDFQLGRGQSEWQSHRQRGWQITQYVYFPFFIVLLTIFKLGS